MKNASQELLAACGRLEKGEKLLFTRAPEGFDAFLCADLTRARAKLTQGQEAVFVHIARDAARSASFREALQFSGPEIEVLDIPAWDCQPYDRVSPHAGIVARRMTALSRLTRAKSSAERPRVITTTIDCLLQRTPPRKLIAAESFSAAPGNVVKLDELALWLEANGYSRASTVHETGEYAQRGGLIDLFPPGAPSPIRLDFFGDTLKSIRSFRLRNTTRHWSITRARLNAHERITLNQRYNAPLSSILRGALWR